MKQPHWQVSHRLPYPTQKGAASIIKKTPVTGNHCNPFYCNDCQIKSKLLHIKKGYDYVPYAERGENDKSLSSDERKEAYLVRMDKQREQEAAHNEKNVKPRGWNMNPSLRITLSCRAKRERKPI